MNFFIQVYQFFNHPLFNIIGGLFTVVAVVGLLITFIFWLLGIAPLLWRLGLGRWTRKIAVVANNVIYSSLEKDLVDSGIFRKRNVQSISKNHLSQIKEHSLILVHYKSCSDQEIRQMLNEKKSTAGMIFYFPEFDSLRGKKKIPSDMIQEIGKKENTVVVNFRGRLLNDIITTLVTTSYEKG